MYALIEFAGKQYKVEEGNSIKVPYIKGEIGSKVTIEKILYIDDGKNKQVGTPLVTGVKIYGEIESHGRERKVVVFKFKRRKGYQKKNTHRQEYSMLKIGKLGKVAKTQTKTVKTKATDTTGISKKTTTKKTSAKKSTAKKTTAKKASVNNFACYEVGEGIEKKVENFADEVRAQALASGTN